MRRSTGSADLLYHLTAPRYETAIAPVMRLFAQDLARQIIPAPTNVLLDVGTGTGLLLRAAAGRAGLAIGVDSNMSMLRVAQSLLNRNHFPQSCLLQMDANVLGGLSGDSVDVAAASFGLSDGEPEAVFRALARVLKPGGRLIFQEWGPYDPVDPRLLVDEALATLADVTIPDRYDDFLTDLALPRPWEQQLQDVDDYIECLTLSGFQAITVQERRSVQVHLPVADFLTYALAWAPRDLVWQALDEGERGALTGQIMARLSQLCDASGMLSWNPVIFRANVVRKR